MPEPLLELAALLAPNDKTLVAELELARDEPETYRKKHGKQLDDLNPSDMPWQALIGGLEKRKRVFVIDWKTFPSDVMWSIDHLLPKDRTRWAWCDLDKYEDSTSTDKFLAVAGRALAASGLGLVSIDDGSDSYPLAIVPFAKVARAQQLAKQTKLGRIDSFAPKTKPAPPPALPPKPAAPPTKRAKQFRVRGGDRLPGKRVHERGIVFTKGDDRSLHVASIASWPPAVRLLTKTYCRIAWGPGSTFATHSAGWVGEDWVTTIELHAGKRPTTIAVPPNLGIADLRFLGDQLLLFPESFSYHLGVATAPCVLAGKRWVPLPGLPRAKPPRRKQTDTRYDTFVLQGLARTGDGRDVILWNDRGYELERGTWVPAYELGRCKPSDEVAAVPVADGFVFVDGEQLKHAVRGKKARVVLPAKLRIEWACAGPAGSVVCCLIRPTSKAPAGVIYFPATKEYALIPATAFSLGRDTWPEVVAYNPALDLVIGIYDHDYTEPTMAPVYGASLLALPRKRL